MTLTLEQIKASVCELPVSQRAELARYLRRSLDGEEDQESAKTEWLALAEQRMAEVHEGKVVGIPAENVLKSLREPRP